MFINSENTVDFPVDTPSLSRVDGLKFIVDDAKDLNEIFKEVNNNQNRTLA